jgi:bifunctional UDP-N-acetylglucosamine pyrophosphorylase/glucosamine-1-phosphate N-acetyltransferase
MFARMSTSSPIAAVVLCAGKGTRMKSALPKVLHLACGRPLCAWSLDAALRLGGKPVVAVVGHGAEEVQVRLAALYGERVATALQADQRGTGHAVQMALPELEGFQGTVVLLYGDTPLLKAETLHALVAARVEAKAPLAVITTRLPDPTGYGRIVRDDKGALARVVEQKDATKAEQAIDEVNVGVYAVEAAFLRTALAQLTPNNAAGELYLTDIVGIARAAGQQISTLEIPLEETLGVNDRVQLAEASRILRRRIVRAAMLGGATFLDPDSVLVDATVQFGTDVIVGPNVVLTGQTSIGDHVEIGAGAVLHDVVVDAGAKVNAYSVCEDAHVGKSAHVGPFARLRPGAVLEEGSHVGNFVELKKTRLGKGSKANHLAYLGDADIGAGCNVGAGTITCNYDGIGKHKTTIGDGVFVGSNSTLVAPVVLGAGSYIAAGSTITKEVEKDALGLGRARQENKPGYVPALKARNAERARFKR